jgi:hypothetical protein
VSPVTIPCTRCGTELYDLLYPAAVAGLAPGVPTPVPHGYLSVPCPACGARNTTADSVGKPAPPRASANSGVLSPP